MPDDFTFTSILIELNLWTSHVWTYQRVVPTTKRSFDKVATSWIHKSNLPLFMVVINNVKWKKHHTFFLFHPIFLWNSLFAISVLKPELPSHFTLKKWRHRQFNFKIVRYCWSLHMNKNDEMSQCCGNYRVSQGLWPS